MGHTSFWAKASIFTPCMPQGHPAAPEKQGKAARAKEEPLQQKARQMPGFSIFGDVRLLSIVNCKFAVIPPL
jgi:hypothetical protein